MEENQKIVIYQTPDGQTQIDVRLEKETVWLNVAQMASLFDKERIKCEKTCAECVQRGRIA